MADLDRGSVVKKLIKVAMDKGDGSKNGPTDRPTNEPTMSGIMSRSTWDDMKVQVLFSDEVFISFVPRLRSADYSATNCIPTVPRLRPTRSGHHRNFKTLG